GVATIAWPYSRLYFREPLFTLIILICAYGLERWRSRLEEGTFRLGWLILSGIALWLAFQAKEASALILPAMLIIAMPRLKLSRRQIIIAAIVVTILALLIGIFLASGARLGNRGLTDRLKNLDFSYVG